MKKILEQTYTIHASKEVVWEALTDQKHIELWSGSPAQMNDEEGSVFSLWNGDIHGKNLEVTDHDELVQEWYSEDWKEPSKVTFTLSPSGNKTVVHLLHEDIPEEDYESIDDGWKEYYMGPLQEYIESELV